MPNVGKSTLFNTLTGLSVHTGNWSGKTVETSVGKFSRGGIDYTVSDLPGAYSLSPRSEEEAVALHSLLFSDYDVCVVVCDESRFFSGFNFLLQVLDSAKRVVVALNFFESAKKEGVKIDAEGLSELLGVQVVRVNARKQKTLERLLDAVRGCVDNERKTAVCSYDARIEAGLKKIAEKGEKFNTLPVLSRVIAIHALCADADLAERFCKSAGAKDNERREFLNEIEKQKEALFSQGIGADEVCREYADAVCKTSEEIYSKIKSEARTKRKLGRADRILTGRILAYPAMLLLFGAVLFITVKLAAYPSEWLDALLSSLGSFIKKQMLIAGSPPWLTGVVCDGALKTLFTVTAVMLPPMALFFPFFTLLEDSGYLPRVAYNLDRPFAACGACGKQSLTMCMGLGCNAVGVSGARIIDTRRERLLAILTNSFVPCNGRFPMLIVISSVFFAGAGLGAVSVLLALIVFSFAVTFFATYILSHTVLKGRGSFFALELPPYRKPDFVHVAVRSVFDRTLKVLGRAAAVAVPAGIIIWCLTNIRVGGTAPIEAVVDFLEPAGRFIGLDGVMLSAFILGLPANETVLPIALSLYGGAGGTAEVLVGAGWTVKTAVCAVVFTLFHWPCSTTVLTIKKETRSLGWTLLSVLIPTFIGVVLCAGINMIFTLCNL